MALSKIAIKNGGFQTLVVIVFGVLSKICPETLVRLEPPSDRLSSPASQKGQNSHVPQVSFATSDILESSQQFRV
jgi:hypothetical protein